MLINEGYVRVYQEEIESDRKIENIVYVKIIDQKDQKIVYVYMNTEYDDLLCLVNEHRLHERYKEDYKMNYDDNEDIVKYMVDKIRNNRKNYESLREAALNGDDEDIVNISVLEL